MKYIYNIRYLCAIEAADQQAALKKVQKLKLPGQVESPLERFELWDELPSEKR